MNILSHNYPTLKLDASYRPVAIVSAIDALVSSIMGKATVLETYDKIIHSPNLSFKLPSVIVVNKIIKKGHGFSCDRKNIYIRDNGKCQYCGCKVNKEQGTIDHVIPRSQGGTITWDNVVLSCFECNQMKGNKTPEQANMKILKKPKPLTYGEYFDYMNFNIEMWKNYC